MNTIKKLSGFFLSLLTISCFAQPNTDIVVLGTAIDGATSMTGSRFYLRGKISTTYSGDNSLITINNGAKVGSFFNIPSNGSISFSIKLSSLYGIIRVHIDDPYYQNNPHCHAGCDWQYCPPSSYGCDSAPVPVTNSPYCIMQSDGRGGYKFIMKKAC